MFPTSTYTPKIFFSKCEPKLNVLLHEIRQQVIAIIVSYKKSNTDMTF